MPRLSVILLLLLAAVLGMLAWGAIPAAGQTLPTLTPTPAPSCSPPEQVTLQPGESLSDRFTGADQGPVLLSLEARVEACSAGGSVPLMTVTVNGWRVEERMLVNKPPTYTLANRWSNAPYFVTGPDAPETAWAVFYSPDFESHNQPGFPYQVLEGDAYRYVFDITALVLPGQTNAVTISNRADQQQAGPYPLVIRHVRVMQDFTEALPIPITGSAAQPPAPRIIIQHLDVAYHGQDGVRVIGSGCPGDDGRGVWFDYHFSVSGVDPQRPVTRILVKGDTSTLTWEWPCSGTVWGLYALDRQHGQWDIYVAPSETATMYTILFFYDDDSFAMGMVAVP
jgi:hypothetical protein